MRTPYRKTRAPRANQRYSSRMSRLSRRQLLGCAIGALAAPRSLRAFADRVVKNGRLKQSVSRWPYQAIPLPEFARACADMGLTAIDLLEETDWPVVAEYGLVCSMGYAGGGTIRDGLNVVANHDAIVRNFAKSIPHAAQLKVPNVITFFGNRRGMPDDQRRAVEQ
jgi:hydroxypyruvate isomerase